MSAKEQEVYGTRGRCHARKWCLLMSLGVIAYAGTARGADLTLATGGRVVVELLTAVADYRNTMALITPTVAVGIRGCKLEAANGLPSERLISEKVSQRGCRVEIDADPSTPGIQPFAAGATLKFALCAQWDADDDCEAVWYSNSASNSDHFEHLRTTPIRSTDFPGQIYQLAWEDQDSGGDEDFNDLIAVVRIAQDSDGDGLWDDWETFGIDTDGNGTIDLDLPSLGAKSDHKDAFLEIDYMDCGVAGGDCAAGDTHNHRPKQAAIDAVVAAFRDATVLNPDGTRGINLHVDVSNAAAHQATLNMGCFQGGVGIGDFDTFKMAPANFGPTNPRRFAYHYAVFAHQQVSTTTSSGCGETGGNDFEVTLGGWRTTGATDQDGDGASDRNVGTVQDQAGALIHEFGHNLGLGHGGFNSATKEQDGVNHKPNYISNMNYSFNFGIPPQDPDGSGPLTQRMDYSRAVLATLDELSLDEGAGIGAGADNSPFFCPNYTTSTVRGNGHANWNCAGADDETGVQADINGDRVCIGVGANGTLETTAASGSDDVVQGQQIFDGPDRTCQTAPKAGSDDAALRGVGDVQVRNLVGREDWGNLQYGFQSMGSFDDGDTSARPLGHRDVDVPLYTERLAADLSISIEPPPSTIPGTSVTLTLIAKNLRPLGARDVTVSILLPTSLTLVSCAASDSGVCGGSSSNPVVSFARLGGGEDVTITIAASLGCAAPVGNQIPVTAQIAHSSPDGDPSNDVVIGQIPVIGRTPVDSMMGFENVSLWHSDQTTLVTSTRTPTQGCHAMDVPGANYRTLTTNSSFSTPLPGTSNTLALDFFIPTGQPDPYWLGAVQMYAGCPSANMNNAYIGQVELTGKPVGAYSTLAFPIPDWIRNTLSAPHTDCYFRIAVNMNLTPSPPTLDNLRFLP